MSTTTHLTSSPKMTPIKYRAACDHCSSTKTKCTQERPSCQRCLALGRDCNYSRSLRAGKPPRSSKKLNHKATAPVLPRPNPQYNSDFSVDPTSQIWSNITTPYTTPSLTPSHGPSYFAPGDLITQTGSSCSQSLSPTHSDWLLDYNHGNDLFTDFKSTSPHPAILESHNRLQFASPMTEMEGEFEELARLHADPVKRLSDTDECVRLATSTLTALYNLPMTSTTCDNDRRPTMDEALDAAALALQNLNTVMAYICAKDFTLPMVILSIASKLLAWYQAVACVQDPFTAGVATAKEIVSDTSTVIGGHDRFSWVLKHQVVQTQLHGLSNILASFRSIYCSDKMTEASLMFASMEGHVRTRLMVTMQEIDSRLRSCVE